MKKLDLYIRDHASGGARFPHSSCKVVFASLLKAQEIAAHVAVPPQKSHYRKVLKELFSISNSILESSTSHELREVDGLVPFAGAPLWPTVKSQLMAQPSSSFDLQLLSNMANFLTRGTLIESNEDQDLILELSKLSRNLCLLGDDSTTSIFHSHINTLLHWIEIETSQSHYLSQTIGLLSLQSSGDCSNHISNIWRILQHKIQSSSSDSIKARGLACSTAMLVALLPSQQSPETLHMLATHWDLLQLHAFASTSSPLSSQALESIGSLGSLALSFTALLDRIKRSYALVVNEFHSLIRSRFSDPSILCPALQALSRILSSKTCASGLSSFLLSFLSFLKLSFPPSEEFLKSWSLLTCTSALRSHSNRLVRFHLAESLVRLALTFDSTTGTNEKRCDLLSLAETITSDPVRSEAERGFAVLTLRVLLKQNSFCSQEVFSPQFLFRMAVVFLSVIRGSRLENSPEKELFVQDVCCSALCEIFQLSHAISLIGTEQTSSHSIYSSLSEKISSLVISTLCREKRSLPSAGNPPPPPVYKLN
jgi:hypothetical protein